jgi:hypothetical protein
LFAEHCEKGGEEQSGETHEENNLDLDYQVGRACPLWEGGNVVAEGGVVDLVDNDTVGSSGLVVRVRPEMRVDSMMNAEVTAENRSACDPR